MKYFFSAIRRKSVDQSWTESDYFDFVKTNCTFAWFCTIQRHYMIASACSLAHKWNNFVGNSSAVCGLFMNTVRLLCLCNKTTLSHNSAHFRGVISFTIESVCSLAHIKNNFCRQSAGSLWIIRVQSQNTLPVWENYTFAQFCAVQRNYLIYSCVCVQPRPQMK